MVKINFNFFWLVILWLTIAFCLPRLVMASSVLISEIMYNPAGADTGREWVEIKNTSTSSISLLDGSWRFNDGSSHLLATSSPTTLLLANEYAVIADDPIKFKLDYPNYNGLLFDSSFSLKNSDNKISLLNNGMEVDSVNYLISWGGADDGHSLEYDFTGNLWRSSYNLGGTPGQPESQPPVNLAPTVQINMPAQATINQTINFNAIVTDPENEPITTIWNFGDGQTDVGVNVSHAYVNDGSFDVVVQAKDSVNTVFATSTIKIIETPTDTSTPISQSNDWPRVEFSELLPNPSGSEIENEWLELYNNSPKQISIDRWQIGDSSIKRFTFKAEIHNVFIPAYGYLLVKRPTSGISLNNTGEQITLYAPDGSRRDQVVYDKAIEDFAFAKSDGSWQWTSALTPGKMNVIENNLETSDDLVLIKTTATDINKQLTASNTKSVITIDKNVEDQIILTEVLPNPIGSDDNEWLEIKNIGGNDVDLFGYYLDDQEGGSQPYYFASSTIVKTGEFLLVKKTESKLSFGNQQDSVRLLGNDKKVLWQIKYDQAKEGQSYALDNNGDWQWTKNLTPGQDNVFSNSMQNPFIEKQNTTTNAEAPLLLADNNSFEQTVGQTLLLPDKTTILVSGVVIVKPGVFSKNIIYLADYNEKDKIVDYTNVIQVYSSHGLFGNIKLYDIVQVIGDLTTVKDERRLKIATNEFPVVINKITNVVIEETPINELNDLSSGGLVKIQGRVLDKKGTSLFVGDGDETAKITFKKISNLKAKDYKIGDAITVVAAIDQQKDKELRLLPQSLADVKKVIVAGASEIATGTVTYVNQASVDLVKTKKDKQRNKIIISCLSLFSLLVIWEAYGWRKRRLKQKNEVVQLTV
jgi:hypothetical protein